MGSLPRSDLGLLIREQKHFEHPDQRLCLTYQKVNTMKKHTTSKNYISLGDLVAAVSSYSRNEREMVTAVYDLFRRGDVVAKTRHGTKRLKLA
jgi:hypothetical protein